MTRSEIKDTLRDYHREVARLTGEIIKQKRRLHHRHTLYHSEGIPTSRLKLEMMQDRLRELTAERNAVQRGIAIIEAGFGKRNWHYSDLLLANLQLVCEQNGCPQFITEARALTKLALKA